jgi:PhnB protein
MTGKRNRLPDNTSLIMPRLVCRDAAAEMDFCLQTFEAVELNRRPGPDGKVAHGLLKIGPEMIMIEGVDVDETVERAVSAGAKILVPLQDQFWGDRVGWFMDPAGHVWTVASRIEETTAEERTARWDKIVAEKRTE